MIASTIFNPPITHAPVTRQQQPASAHDQRSSGNAFAASLRAAASQGPEKLRLAAEQMVSTAFILPVLASMHDSPFAHTGPFAPGTAEKRFAPLLDEKLADSITRKSNLGLVRSITRKFTPPTSASETAA